MIETVTYPRYNPDGWHHFAIAWDGTVVVNYVDGVEIDRSPCTALQSRTPEFTVGGNDEGGTAPFEGLIDEFLIFDKALTVEEIRALGGWTP